MPDFSSEFTLGKTFYSNVTEWVKRTGRIPDYASATFTMAGNKGVACPVFIPRPMIVRELYVANGASPAGFHQVALLASAANYSARLLIVEPRPYGGIFGTPAAQAGANAWQRFPVTPRPITAGLYWLCYSSSVNTGTVQRLFNPINVAGYEAQFGGVLCGMEYPLEGAHPVFVGSPVTPVLAVGGSDA